MRPLRDPTTETPSPGTNPQPPIAWLTIPHSPPRPTLVSPPARPLPGPRPGLLPSSSLLLVLAAGPYCPWACLLTAAILVLPPVGGRSSPPRPTETSQSGQPGQNYVFVVKFSITLNTWCQNGQILHCFIVCIGSHVACCLEMILRYSLQNLKNQSS